MKNVDIAPDVADAAHALANHLATAFKSIKSLRPELPTPVQGLDHAALPLLYTLSSGEPHRVGSLAEACHADLSATSRYATALARLGLVAKSPDPEDRRAQVLVITDDGREVVGRLRERRGALFGAILATWSADDIRRFDAYLTRFAADIERHVRPCAVTTTTEEA